MLTEEDDRILKMGEVQRKLGEDVVHMG